MSDNLPVYKSNTTPEQRMDNLKFYHKQYSLIKNQHEIGTPALFVKVRCGCLKLICLKDAYRCLYCGIWFCKKCAEQHFGAKSNN